MLSISFSDLGWNSFVSRNPHIWLRFLLWIYKQSSNISFEYILLYIRFCLLNYAIHTTQLFSSLHRKYNFLRYNRTFINTSLELFECGFVTIVWFIAFFRVSISIRTSESRHFTIHAWGKTVANRIRQTYLHNRLLHVKD